MEAKCKFSVNDHHYSCNIKNVTITRPRTEIIGVEGVHKAGRSNADVVKVLIVHQSSVEYIPRGLEKFFPNLIYLEMIYCGIKTISRNDLVGLENLESLILGCNPLESLPNDLFADMKKLKNIRFRNSKLTTMSSRLLEPVKDTLEAADFRDNTRINASYFSSNSLFQGTTSTLEKLMDIIDACCIAPNEEHFEKKSKSKAETVIKDLWDTHRFADFIITVGSQHFLVHKNILGIQSPVFTEIFYKDMKEARSGKMEIENFTAAAVEEFLRFFYTGKIQKQTNAMELFALAGKYDVSDLKSITETIVWRNIDNKNAVEVLNLGNLYESEKLKIKAFQEVQKMFPEVKLTSELKDKPEVVMELLEEKRTYKEKTEKVEQGKKRKLQELTEQMRQAEEEAKEEKETIKKKFKMNILEKCAEKD
jgi:BTB/POZ domain